MLNSSKGRDKNKNSSEIGSAKHNKQPADPNKWKCKYCDKEHDKSDDEGWKSQEKRDKAPQLYKKK